MTRRWPCFAVASPGLEALVAAELREWGCTTELVDGGASFEASLPALAALLPQLGCASRVLVRVARARVDSPETVASLLRSVPWELMPPAPPGVLLRLSGAGAAPDRIRWLEAELLRQLGGLFGADKVARGATADQPGELSLAARLESRECTLSVDAGGALLHQRGYRIEAGPAPLRETLACALLRAAGWQGLGTLWDPMCGSGTIPIEAARVSARHCGLELPQTRVFATEQWRIGVEPALPTARQPLASHIFAGDIDVAVIGMAQRNGARAGIGDLIHWQHAEMAAQACRGELPGFLVTNPPYGQRIGGRNAMRRLIERLGAVMARRCVGWRAGLLLYERDLVRQLPIARPDIVQVDNGGLRLWLVSGDIGPASRRTGGGR